MRSRTLVLTVICATIGSVIASAILLVIGVELVVGNQDKTVNKESKEIKSTKFEKPINWKVTFYSDCSPQYEGFFEWGSLLQRAGRKYCCMQILASLWRETLWEILMVSLKLKVISFDRVYPSKAAASSTCLWLHYGNMPQKWTLSSSVMCIFRKTRANRLLVK